MGAALVPPVSRNICPRRPRHKLDLHRGLYCSISLLMRNKDRYTVDVRRLELLSEFFSVNTEKSLSVRTSPGGQIAISCAEEVAGKEPAEVKTSHSGAAPTSGSPRRRRGAPPGNQRALKTGYHTAERRALRSRLARMLGEINLTLALLGKTDPVKRRRLRRVKLKCFTLDKALVVEKARAAERGPHLVADPAIFSPSALDSPATGERPAKGIVDE